MYLCGARLSYFSAILPITDGLGLAFAVTRYDGRVVISPTSCRELMPDPEAFAQAVRDSFQDYLALARRPAAPAKRSKAAPRAAAASAKKPKPAPRPAPKPAVKPLRAARPPSGGKPSRPARSA